jgi:tight adherence protein C
MSMLLPIAGGLTFLLVLCAGLVALSMRPSAQAQRLLQVVTGERAPAKDAALRGFEHGLIHLLMRTRERFGLRVSDKLKERLSSAGYRSTYAADVFTAAQWCAPLLGAASASFLQDNVLFWAVALAGIAYILPGAWLAHRIRVRKEILRRSLPDTMDLLVICVDAGLGMDQAMLRVGEELAVSHKEIQQEFHRIQLEQRAGSPRLEAWRRFAARVEIDEVNSFVSMLSQTERFGTPIARALSRFAEELRAKRRQRAEEAAAKTKVKIVFPLVFFIFPCLFIVLLAPAILGIMHVFQGLK